MTPNQILDKIVKSIQKEVDRFDSGIPSVERRVYERIIELSGKLKTRGGRLENSVENIRAISELSSEIEKLIIDPKYKASVTDFTKAFEVVSQLQQSYFASLSVKVGRKDLLKAIQKDAVGYTVKQLTDQGVAKSVSQGIESILRRNITEGGSLGSMIEQMRAFIVSGVDENGNPIPGAVRRYARQITTDSLNQFSATYNETISEDLGFEWRMYTGSLLETSRPWCVHMVEKKYVHKSELQTVISDNIDGVKICSKDIPCNKKTGLPSGMIEGTNASNVAQRRGGWQCGHQFGGVPSAVVPKELRLKFES